MVAYQRRRPKPRGQPPKSDRGKEPGPDQTPAGDRSEQRRKDDLQRGADRHEKQPGREDYGR